jgi:hypothetical protein
MEIGHVYETLKMAIDTVATSRGSSSIREKLYGSVLYAMLSRQVLRVPVGPGYAIGQ